VGTDKHYRAFISYSQQDKVWGKRLHGWLETYRVPLGGVVDIQLPPRLGRFFRDDEDMAAAASIADQVSAAIEDAESLIVICSPRSAQSKWVNSEIHHFRRTGRGRKVFAFIIDGVPNSGDPETECFPPALRAAGDPDDPDALPIEPLGLDVRKDGKAKACARLAAGLLDVDFDDLWQRDRRRAERRQRLLLGGLAAASLVFAALAATAVMFALQSQKRAAILSIEGARSVLEQGDADGALLVLLEASKAFNPGSAPDDLLIAFDETLQRASAETLYPLPANARLFDAPHGVFIVDPATGDISLLTVDAAPRPIARLDSPPTFIAQASDGSIIAVRDDLKIERIVNGRRESLGAFEPQTLYGPPNFREYAGVPFSELTLSADGMLLLQPHDCVAGVVLHECEAGARARVQLFDTTAKRLQVLDLPAPDSVRDRFNYVRASNGRRLVFWTRGVVDLDNPRARPASTPRTLLALWCNAGEPMPRDVQAAFDHALHEGWGDDDTPMMWCSAADGAIQMSAVDGQRLDGRADFVFSESDASGQDPDVRSILKDYYLIDETTAYVMGGVRGAYLGQVSAARFDNPTHTLALTYGRDLLVGVRTLHEWRMPNVITYVQLLGGDRVAVADLDSGYIHVLDYSTYHPYAARRLSAAETARYTPSVFNWPRGCPAIRADVDGAKLEVAYSGKADDSGEAGDERTTVRVTRAGRTVERAFDVQDTCPRLSADGRHLAVIDRAQAAHILDVSKLSRDAPDAEIGLIPGALDVAFPDNSPAVVIARNGGVDPSGFSAGVVISRMEPGPRPDAWRTVQTLHQGTGDQLEAKLDATGRRALLFETLGTEQDRGGILWSLEAGRAFRRLGVEYRWYDAGFMETGEAFTTTGYEDDGAPIVLAIAPHDLPQARSAALARLSPHCRTFAGEAYRRSPCWPRQFAD
jgi:hypothetical protein